MEKRPKKKWAIKSVQNWTPANLRLVWLPLVLLLCPLIERRQPQWRAFDGSTNAPLAEHVVLTSAASSFSDWVVLLPRANRFWHSLKCARIESAISCHADASAACLIFLEKVHFGNSINNIAKLSRFRWCHKYIAYVLKNVKNNPNQSPIWHFSLVDDFGNKKFLVTRTHMRYIFI